MGWLFYKSLDEQGEITASSSHLSLLIPGGERCSQQGGEGEVGKGRNSEGRRLLCVCCHSQRTLPAPQPGWLLVKKRGGEGGEAELVQKAPVLKTSEPRGGVGSAGDQSWI